MSDISQELAAALAEMSYRRAASDQSLDLPQISNALGLSDLVDFRIGATPEGLSGPDGGYYYNDTTYDDST